MRSPPFRVSRSAETVALVTPTLAPASRAGSRSNPQRATNRTMFA